MALMGLPEAGDLRDGGPLPPIPRSRRDRGARSPANRHVAPGDAAAVRVCSLSI
jgi:hypothetical protein